MPLAPPVTSATLSCSSNRWLGYPKRHLHKQTRDVDAQGPLSAEMQETSIDGVIHSGQECRFIRAKE